MKVKKTRSIVIVFLSLFILVGYGHGFGPIGIIEIIVIPNIFLGDSYIQNSYERDMFTSALFLLIGQLILISSLFLKNQKRKFIEIAGIIILLIGFYILVFPMNDSLRRFSFYSGLPFLVIGVITLITRVVKLKKRT